jgi:hypothetical protein
MGQLIAISIDVTKLDKSKFVKGKKGTYANITVSVNDEDDQFGNNTSVWESQTKEERDDKVDRNFLGNGKVVWSSQSSNDTKKTSSKKASKQDDDSDDLPF